VAIPAGTSSARTTPYRSLPSKDELAAEWLRVCNVRFWQRWEAMARRHPGNPRKQLKTAFTLLARHVSEPATRGCGMAHAAVESSANDDPARRAIEAHKAKLRAKLAELCVRSGAREPELLAEQLFLLMDGAQATLILGVQGPGRNVGPAAASLIDSRLGEPS
jgi:AcrR family transcriptional regulator